MLSRLVTSRWVKLGFLALALGFCVYGLLAERAAVAAALSRVAWYSAAGALVAAFIGLGCTMLAWRALLTDLGSPLPVRAAGRIFFVAQLAKYLPGAVWAPAAQVELAHHYQVPRTRSASAVVVFMGVALATGLLVASAALPLASGQAASHYRWALALTVPVLVGLYPPVTGFVLDRLLGLVGRPLLERRISMAGMARAIGWWLLAWVFYGVQAWLLVVDVGGKGWTALPLAVGAYALAWSVGFILIPFPGGVGPRELALIAALAPVMPTGPAIVVAVISRLVMTIGDLAWAALASALGRGRRPGDTREQDQASPARDSARLA